MLSQGDSTPGPTLERLSHQYYSAKQPLKENSFRWPSGDSNRGPSVPQSDSLPLDYHLASFEAMGRSNGSGRISGLSLFTIPDLVDFHSEGAEILKVENHKREALL